MLFNSMGFLTFFPTVCMIYFLISPNARYLWLLAASYFFYMCWNPQYLFLILFSTIITYLSGVAMEKIKRLNPKVRARSNWLKICVALSIFLNLALLFYFKYWGFAIANINRIIAKIGLQISFPMQNVLLPVGISFYIFQALGYTIDVYRGDIYAEKNFFRYALFVSFFPQLVAGPIERSRNLLKQVGKPTYFDINNVREGLLTMAYGLFIKVVVADRLSGIINPVYANWNEQNGMCLLTATVLFAFQIYCDFEGYSQLAIGSAKTLGFSINRNFDTPYLSGNVHDFWKRWHISLTSWFRDYLYIPLGGNRKGKLRKHLNTMIVFLVSGLWHGASWHFVAWGGINGIYHVMQDVTLPFRKKAVACLRVDAGAFMWKCFCCFVTFALVDVSWLFFRADGIRSALTILVKIGQDFSWRYLFADAFYNLFGSARELFIVFFSLAIVFFIDVLRYKKIDLKAWVLKQQLCYRWIIYFTIILVIILWGAYGSDYEQTQFIYFQF